MGRYILITPGYPSEKNKYNNTFVHARVKNYLSRGVLVDIFCVNRKPFAKPKNGAKYVYEGVTVEQGNIDEMRDKLQSNKYDKILIHFAIKKIVSTTIRVSNNTPLIIWSHGVDIIPWHKRIYNLQLSNVIKFAGYALLNTLQRLYLKKVVKKYGDMITFVFVSDWQKNVAEKSIWSVNKIKSYSIIPNIVDEKVFKFQQKTKDARLKILSIRSFRSRNYANDLTVKAIKALSQKPYFNELRFTICGDGRLWEKTVKPLREYQNVQLKKGFFSHSEIAQLHKEHGVILMPSRQDTHGVSTSEAMSSGLVPISSNNSAIPEFVPTSCGYLANRYLDIVSAIEDIYMDAERFLASSKEASEFIQRKCASSVVIKREIELVES